MVRRTRFGNARGAVLVHVAIIMIAMIAMSALAVDLGVQYVGRRQIQNAADAAALAAAISRSFVNPTNMDLAQASAVAAAQQNDVWGQDPGITTADVTFPVCPSGAPGVPDTCVRAAVYRTNYGGSATTPLPTFFSQLVGVNDQGVRASATAQMRAGTGTADCVKPVAIPDRWVELRPAAGAWTPTSTFERYRENGAGAGTLLTPNADRYDPPTSGSAGSGFTVDNDYGMQLLLKEGNGGQGIDPGWYYPVVINPGCNGGNCYRDAWSGCVSNPVGPGTVLNPEPGNMIGPTRQGVDDLIAADPSATWSTSANGGRGGVVGGCMQAGTCTRSPRWIAVPVFDVDQYQYARAVNNDNGRNTPITIVKIIGFFLEDTPGNDVLGRITHYPTTVLTGTPIPGSAMFARTVILVR